MKKRDIALAILSLLLFYAIVQSSAGALIKFIASIFIFILLTNYYKRTYNIPTMYGFLLLRTRKGLLLLNKIAKKHSDLITLLADMSLGLTFGLLSLFLLDWMSFKRRLVSVVGGFLLLIGIFFLYPAATLYITSFASMPASSQTVQGFDIVLPLITFIGGLFSSTILVTYKAAFSILAMLWDKFVVGSDVVVAQGATLLLPGVTIPLVEGIFALATVLIIHEAAHGILAIAGRIRLKSTGLVFFGSLPVGGFVEPDEQELMRRPKEVQARTIIAGVGANFFATLIFGFIFLSFLAITGPFTANGCFITGGNLPHGTVVTAINGVPGCSSHIEANSTVDLTLSSGETVTFVSDANGKIGILAYPLGSNSMLRFYSNPLLSFLYHVLGLTLVINLFVGIINLLPVPLFDGDYILSIFAGKSLLYKALRYSVLLSFLLLLLPGLL
ncbi:MAG: hypothetical protein D6769_01895 [Methanobacteriota archaeon]|nr:MAG: hypothetical protein D6769_01895 [Euryarchaeota archaeon]